MWSVSCLKKRVIILPIVFVLLLAFSVGVFLITKVSYEKRILADVVENYLQTEYGLTPENIDVYFSIDGMCGAWVEVEEKPFHFEVNINRNSKMVRGDQYLESLVEYYLEEHIREKTNSLIDGDNIMVILSERFSKDSTESDPSIVLSIPLSYYCSVDGVEVGTETSFLVLQQITTYFSPTMIFYDYVDTDGKERTVCIDKQNFSKIYNCENLKELSS